MQPRVRHRPPAPRRSSPVPGNRSPRGGTGRALTSAALAVALLVVPWTGPAAAGPSDQPGGTTAVLESEALDRLQQRAAEVQDGLREQQREVVEARRDLRRAQVAVSDAESALTDAEGELAGHQQVVAAYARAVYRDGGALSPLSLLLSGGDPGEMAAALGFLDAVDRHAADVIGTAERHRQAAMAQQARARQALERAGQREDAVAARVAELEDAAAAVTDELDAALAVVDRQLAELQADQLEVNRQTAANWRAYRQQLAQAGVTPPPASALLDPTSGLPGELVPLAASTGGAQRGAAQLPRQPSSLLVLPAETLDAVSAAMDALGQPYAPGTSGPDSWSCGDLVQSVYAAADVPLPDTQGELFAVTAPVRLADVLPGDLVFLGSDESGLGHVAIALDQETMLAADARAGAVVVRTMPRDEVIGVGRPSAGRRAAVAAPRPEDGAMRVECGNPVYPPSFDGVRQWGGYPNGLIPPSAMCDLGAAGHRLRCDAAAAWRAMAAAYAADFGSELCITDSYRTYAGQVRLYAQKPALAAVPGTSNHGWGLATDLCGGIQSFGTPQYRWMVANAGRFGWLHPEWADPGNGREEPWHWEYAGS
jgi:cell wall-associated NlpC family hydrolase